MSLTDRLDDVPPCDLSDYHAFIIDGRRYGAVVPAFVECLRPFPEIFTIDDRSVTLSPALKTPDERTVAVAGCLETLRAGGFIPGWRDEFYPVGTGFGRAPVLLVERASAPLFGIRIFAINMCGFVRTDDTMAVWVARRAQTKETSPGKLDTIVSGGQPAGLGLRENLIKECGEEAGISPRLAARATAAGGISFCTERPEGVLDYFQFSFDLELPADFIPENTDGEIQDFTLWPAKDLLVHLSETDAFAYDSAMVFIDFMIRHGIIPPDHPDYVRLLHGLRTGCAI